MCEAEQFAGADQLSDSMVSITKPSEFTNQDRLDTHRTTCGVWATEPTPAPAGALIDRARSRR